MWTTKYPFRCDFEPAMQLDQTNVELHIAINQLQNLAGIALNNASHTMAQVQQLACKPRGHQDSPGSNGAIRGLYEDARRLIWALPSAAAARDKSNVEANLNGKLDEWEKESAELRAAVAAEEKAKKAEIDGQSKAWI
ncbi:hypothetical protein V496_06770 [Pseudogymnoascus sp. VKM F-4515 (FW-2607)]|nr:hypothetical protein V496_06770 [Pseudogymnoascus sp. VKM F-4515 (FW-2607)]